MPELGRENTGYAYSVGTATLDKQDLEGVISAINYLRSHGMVISAGTYERSGSDLTLPLVMRSGSGPEARAATKAVAEILDSCAVSWRRVRPASSSPESLRMARAIDAVKIGSNVLTVADVTPPGDGGDPFEGLVGMNREVELLKRIAAAAHAYGRSSLESLHMVLRGNPGVGKTEFARRMAAYFYEQGVISGGLHKVSAAELICEHVGSAPRLMRAAFDKASGGILFIDEAYALSQGGGNEFGIESVNQLTECLDSRRDEVIVVVAGYPNEMDDFLASNPGLRERFGFTLTMEGYSAEELSSIYESFAGAKGFLLEEDAKEGLPGVCAKLMGSKDFAAARTMRKVFDASVLSAAKNHPDIRKIGKEDLFAAAKLSTHAKACSRVIGFTSC